MSVSPGYVCIDGRERIVPEVRGTSDQKPRRRTRAIHAKRGRMAGTVWVLGAGFSMPLGGPSFRDLISEPVRIQASGALSEEEKSWAYAVVQCYQASLRGEQQAGAGLWRDPEEYLELLELAKDKPHSFQAGVISGLCQSRVPTNAYKDVNVNGTLTDSTRQRLVHDIYRESLRFCAAACTTFLSDAESDTTTALQTERWEPYVRWKRELLVKGDTVITFNWDRVLDLLGSTGGVELAPLLPAESLRSADSIPVFHLHGHVNWQRVSEGSSEVIRVGDRLAAVKLPKTAVLGMPGASKKLTAESILMPLWRDACARLAAADNVVFVGYRFPPSDNMSKLRLLGALKTSNVTRMHVVLGPRSQGASRLAGLLNWTDKAGAPARDIRLHEMGAEDFLAVVERRHL
jgi:hypothetical protein